MSGFVYVCEALSSSIIAYLCAMCNMVHVMWRFVIPKCYFLFLKLYGESLSRSHKQAKIP